MNIIDVKAHTELWYKLKHEDITASETACFYDPKSFKTELAIYYEKRAENHPEPSKFGDPNYIRMQAGLFLEPFIAEMFKEYTGVDLTQFEGYCRHATVDRMAASPDYVHPALKNKCAFLDEVRGNVTDYITWEDGPGIAELKVANTMAWNSNYIDNEPPLKYLVQLQHQLACTGYKWGMIVTLVDNDALDIAIYRADPSAIADIEKSVNQFWHKVDNNIEPDPSERDSDATLMRSLYDEYTDEQVDMSDNDKLLKAGLLYIDAHIKEKSAKKLKGKARNVAMQITKDQADTVAGIMQFKNSGKRYLIRERKDL